jgi:flagellar biosynthesis protein FlhG
MTATADTRGRRDGVVTIAITSGKGGVGKTSVTVNLAVALARLGNRVAILDADFGLGNVDVLLGLAPPSHLGHLLTGERTIREIMVPGPMGVQIIPASSGLRELTALTPAQWDRLNEGLGAISSDLDFLLIDTAAGISDNVVDLLITSERILLVTSLEPTAVVDAYAMIKILTVADARKEIGLLVNGARDASEADLVFRQLDVAATRFLQRRLRYYGFVTFDPSVREAVLMQRPIVDHQPQAPASRCFRILASRVAGLTPLGGPGLRLVRPGPRALTFAGPTSPDTEAPRCA